MPNFHRLAHMKNTPLVKKGEWVKRGQTIGLCGSTGKSTGAHCHYDIIRSLTPLTTFTEYVYRRSKAWVMARYVDPTPYIKGNVPMANSFPRSGWGFLQWARNYWHPGIDLNGVNDLGKPIYSPVEGPVKCVLGTTWFKNWLGRWLSKNWNSGWGNMVVIEEMPGYDGELAVGVPLKQGLNEAQVTSLRKLAAKPVSEWSKDDKKNWAWGTNNGALPKQ